VSKLKIDRRPQRVGLFVPMKGNRSDPNLVFPLADVDSSELDELIRGILEKGGITDESTVQAIIEQAEQDSEVRLKVNEAKAEFRRLMQLKREGKKLMSCGFRKWREVHYPAVNRFKK
jgi:hypothetical protein